MMCYCRPGDHLFSFFYWEIFHLILMIFISNYYIEYIFPPPDEFTSSSSVTKKAASSEGPKAGPKSPRSRDPTVHVQV